VTATASDGTDTAIAADTLSVTVDAVADAPVLTVTNTSGAEDTRIALDVTATSPDTVSVTFAGVPDGAVLSAGIDNGDGTWTVDAGDLAGLTLTPPADYSGTLNLFAVATATDGSESATTSEAFSVTVTPVADAPTLSAADVTGAEDTAIALDIDTAVTDGSEVLSITIGNIPDGAVLNAGTVNPDGTVTLTPTELTGLTITPPADFSGSFDLSITSTSTDGTDTATVSDTFGVT
ncbi:Ig-like domain-containing protein, partial [Thalassospira mesophila]|uniref:Ig-like domain-containing protein n=1 Tax=Thalassospira mesophila TaxID=1293891 RepID=UPI001302D9B6